jgi:hypothetical protein
MVTTPLKSNLAVIDRHVDSCLCTRNSISLTETGTHKLAHVVELLRSEVAGVFSWGYLGVLSVRI